MPKKSPSRVRIPKLFTRKFIKMTNPSACKRGLDEFERMFPDTTLYGTRIIGVGVYDSTTDQMLLHGVENPANTNAWIVFADYAYTYAVNQDSWVWLGMQTPSRPQIPIPKYQTRKWLSRADKKFLTWAITRWLETGHTAYQQEGDPGIHALETKQSKKHSNIQTPTTQ